MALASGVWRQADNWLTAGVRTAPEPGDLYAGQRVLETCGNQWSMADREGFEPSVPN